jgi:hypothetical protein
MPSPFREQHHAYIQRYHETGKANILGSSRIVEVKTKTGEIFSACLSLSRVQLETPSHFLFTAIFQEVRHQEVEFRISADGVIRQVIGPSREAFGWNEDEIIGRKMSSCLPPSIAEIHRQCMNEATTVK